MGPRLTPPRTVTAITGVVAGGLILRGIKATGRSLEVGTAE